MPSRQESRSCTGMLKETARHLLMHRTNPPNKALFRNSSGYRWPSSRGELVTELRGLLLPRWPLALTAALARLRSPDVVGGHPLLEHVIHYTAILCAVATRAPAQDPSALAS